MKPNEREQVIEAVDALRVAEKSFHQANAQLQTARSAGSATATLQGRVEHEAATERLLEAAATAEASLDSYRKQTETDYHKSIQDATIDSRRLHAERLVLEEQLGNLKAEIVIVEQREKPLVDAAVEAQQTASIFANDWGRVVIDAVKLTQTAAAA
jgi:hypothetical protein